MVDYCGVCSLPYEYCGYSGQKQKCETWLSTHDKVAYARYYIKVNISEQDQLEKALEEAKIGVSTREANSAEDENSNLKNEESKHQKRGGKGLARDEEKRILREDERRKKAKVTITLVDRNRRKSVTHVNGVDSFGLDLKTVAKRLAGKYACGCSVVKSPAGEDEIVIQGDVVDDLIAFLSGEWSEISPDQIVYKPKPQKKK